MLAKSVAVILLTLSPGLATAAPFSVSSFVFDRLEAPGFIGGNFDSGGAGGIASIADTYISASAQLTSAAQAIASFGTLGVQSFADFAISGTPLTRAYAVAIASSSDDITISSPALNGSQGQFVVYYALDGTVAATGGGSSVAQVAVTAVPAGGTPQVSNQAYTSLVTGTFAAQNPFTFIFGEPFFFQSCLGAATGLGIVPAVLPSSGHLTTAPCSPGALLVPLIGSGTGSANFFNTFTISGFAISDSSGNSVENPQITSASGAQYPIQAVPEPASLVLMPLGFAAIALRRRRALPSGRIAALDAQRISDSGHYSA
jgi:hypothetical protein